MLSFWNGAHRLEVWSGVAAGLLGWVGLGLAFLAPLGHYTSSSTVCDPGCFTTTVQGTENLAALALPAGVWTVLLELLSLCLLCLIVSAVLHPRTGERGWRRLLWGSTLLLVGGIAWMWLAFAAYSVGLLLAPAAVLAGLSAWTAWRSPFQPPPLPAPRLWPEERQSKGRGHGRGIEVLSGVSAGFLGLENLVIAVFAPLGNETTSGGTSCIAHVCTTVEVRSKVNSLETGFIPPEGLVVLALVFLCLLSIALSAVLDRHTGGTHWSRVLWISTLLLGGFVAWTVLNTYAFFIGAVLLPALVLALVAACASLVGGAPAQLL